MVAHEVVHLVQRLGRRLDDHVDAVAEHVELEVGHQRRDLDQRVGARGRARSSHSRSTPVGRSRRTLLSRVALRDRPTVTAHALESRGWAGLLARLVVGGVWVVAGVLKLPDPAENVRAVRAYQLLPESRRAARSVMPCRCWRSWSGVCLLARPAHPVAAVLSALMLVAFVVGISSAWARGLQIECGCFGGGAGRPRTRPRSTPGTSPATSGCCCSALWLVWRPRTPWAADNRLLPAGDPTPVTRQRTMTREKHLMTKKKSTATRRAESQAAVGAGRRDPQGAGAPGAAPSVGGRDGAVVVVLAVVLGDRLRWSQSNRGHAPAGRRRLPRVRCPATRVPAGKASAPVKVVVYEDFMCPFCGQFEAASRDCLPQT